MMKFSKSGSSVILVLLALTAFAANTRFPDAGNPNPRVGTPDDPRFDCAEPDNEDSGGDHDCAGVLFDEHLGLFGFAPSSTRTTAIYKDVARFGQGQISGSSVDRAWKQTIGDPRVIVSVTDTGIRWHDEHLRRKTFLNHRELPRPQDSAGRVGINGGDLVFDGYDVNADGRFDVEDYAGDPRVDIAAGGREDSIDAQDLIRAFSSGVDDDANGYVDDIAGWDFFENDNDASDTTSYSAAGGHGSGRMKEAAEETNDGIGEAGVCPQCRVMPMRIWDTFVTPGDNWAQATVYAADMGVQVQVVANGMLQNTRAARLATTYAHERGMSLMHVSSDLNTESHNFPTNYVESIFINGCAADVHGASSEIPNLSNFLAEIGLSSNAPIQTWFRSSNLTQFGAHAHVCWEAVTGSEATGHAGGGAGMVHSMGLARAAAIGGALSTDEVKQLITLTSEDVTPVNTVGAGTPDPSQLGWDEYFGYGRFDVNAALTRIAPGKIPPEALIQSPSWWAILDPEAGEAVTIRGFARAARSTACTFRLEYAIGIQPANDAFTEFESGSCPAGRDAVLGILPVAVIALEMGSHTFDGSVPLASPGGRADPNAHMFTVRLVVEDGETVKNRGEDRKVYVALHDPSWHAGWPQFADVGGESSPLLYDMDGDGTLEILDANSAGELCVTRHDGTPLAAFNGGACWQLPPTWNHHPNSPGFASGAVPALTGGLRSPSVADIDGDFEPEIVLPAGDGRLFVIEHTGAVKYQIGVDVTLSEAADRNERDHPKRGFLGNAVISDLDRNGSKEIIAAALDGYVYVWDAATGTPRAGFPKELRSADADDAEARGELIATPTIANLDADPELEIVSTSSDYYSAPGAPPPGPPGMEQGSAALVAALLANTAGGTSRIYALNHDGSEVDGWPVPLAGLLPDVLPFIGPQHMPVSGDLDGDGDDEVVAAITTGDLHLIDGDGSFRVLTSQGTVNGGAGSEPTRIINLFEYPALGNLNGIGDLDVTKIGVSAPALVNLLLVGQNLPFNHVVQAWDTANVENYLPGYPTTHDDFGLLSQPAIADLDGGGGDIVAGSGVYLLQAYNGRTGLPLAGFPKQAGGWLFAVPAIGDIDDDGLLEIVASTREGWRFVWDTTAPATPATNNEWWTESHDECHSNHYGTDCRPPNRVRGLALAGGALSFTAPGDDWNMGSVDRYELRTAAQPIVTAANWYAASALPDVSASGAAGSTTLIPVDGAALRFVAIAPVDDAGNRAKFIGMEVNPPAPVNGGAASVSTVATVSGAAGATLDAGSFRLTNTGNQPHTVGAVSLAVGNPAVLASLRLRLPDGRTVEVTNVGASNAFTFNPALTLAPGAQADFALSATLASAGAKAARAETAAATTWLPVGMAVAHAGTGSATPSSPVPVSAALLLIALFAFALARRQRGLAAIALALGLTLAGCGNNDSAPGTVPPPVAMSTTVDLAAVAANSGATPIAYSGLPARVAVVTRNP